MLSSDSNQHPQYKSLKYSADHLISDLGDIRNFMYNIIKALHEDPYPIFIAVQCHIIDVGPSQIISITGGGN